jgi:hypothetical protein
MKVTCITHRRDPIFAARLKAEGTLPGSYSENSVMSSVQRAAIAWLNSDVDAVGDRRIRKHYQGQPNQIAHRAPVARRRGTR